MKNTKKLVESVYNKIYERLIWENLSSRLYENLSDSELRDFEQDALYICQDAKKAGFSIEDMKRGMKKAYVDYWGKNIANEDSIYKGVDLLEKVDLKKSKSPKEKQDLFAKALVDVMPVDKVEADDCRDLFYKFDASLEASRNF